MHDLQNTIESAFADRARLTPKNVPQDIKHAISEVMELLDSGKARIAEKKNGAWQIHEWLKKAVLLYFRTHDNEIFAGGFTQYFDKVPLKYPLYKHDEFVTGGVRVVPPAIARKGAYIAPNTVLMPSYINIGAYVDAGTMIDTWATVGSCAQIGKNVHISGGTGIGGVLEPLQASPTIIEDNCFIGARSEIVEGVIVEEGRLSPWVFLLDKAPVYTIAKTKRFFMAVYQQARLWYLAACPQQMAVTACTALLLSNGSMPKPEKK